MSLQRIRQGIFTISMCIIYYLTVVCRWLNIERSECEGWKQTMSAQSGEEMEDSTVGFWYDRWEAGLEGAEKSAHDAQ